MLFNDISRTGTLWRRLTRGRSKPVQWYTLRPRFRQDFAYATEDDVYRGPAGEQLTRRFTSAEHAISKTTKIKYKLLRIDLARPALLLIDRLLETNSERLLKPRGTEICLRRGAKLAR
jgi:hypothetical protein